MFDVDKMADVADSAIQDFASRHQDEVFYAFAIDANLLCLNSVAEFDKSLTYFQEKWGERYHQQKFIDDLKFNTGDWKYQGFAELAETCGFDRKLYDEHYKMSGEAQKTSAYGRAMDALLENLKNRDAAEPNA